MAVIKLENNNTRENMRLKVRKKTKQMTGFMSRTHKTTPETLNHEY